MEGVLLVLSVMFVAPVSPDMTFGCEGDICTRGVQYCMEDMRRCGYCSHEEALCGTPDLPRDCDSYCLDIQLKEMTGELNGTKETVNNLTSQVAVLKQRIHENKQIIANLKKEKETLKLNLTESFASLQDLNKKNTDVSGRLSNKTADLIGCERERQTYVFVLVTLILLFLAVTGVLVCRLCQRKTHGRQGGGADQKPSEVDSIAIQMSSQATDDSGLDMDIRAVRSRSLDTGDTSESPLIDSDVVDEKEHCGDFTKQLSPNNIPPCNPSGPSQVVYR